MSKYVEISDRTINKLIPKKNMCFLEWVEKDHTMHLIIHMAPDDRGIKVPEDQSARVLEEMREFWEE